MGQTDQENERLRRWRLVLGEPDPKSDQTGEGLGLACELSKQDIGMEQVLGALYDSERSGGLGRSCPNVNRWLGDIRTYFPSSVVQLMQKDALERLNLKQMLLQPEMLNAVDPDVHLVATLMSLSRVIPEATKQTAREVVRKVVRQLEERLRNPLIQAVKGSLQRSMRTRRPKAGEIDWNRTIRMNLKNYLPERKTIIAEKLVGFGRKRSSLRDVILCVDQSGSMASSVVYSAIFGAVMASIRAIATRMIVFDTAVVDLTENLQDPVDLLFGTQLGGGTDIARALAYCQQTVTKPFQTILVLITDLYEGGSEKLMFQHAAELVSSGVQLICLLALNDKGRPSFHEGNASKLTSLGVPTFACTPDQFPGLMATAINRQDITMWAAKNNIVPARAAQV